MGGCDYEIRPGGRWPPRRGADRDREFSGADGAARCADVSGIQRDRRGYRRTPNASFRYGRSVVRPLIAGPFPPRGRSFLHTAGRGTVVTGTVHSGGGAGGDQVVISPSGKAARVRALHAQNRSAERGQAGDRCALNLAGDQIGKDAIRRGDVVLDPQLHAPASRIDVKLQVLASETRPVTQWMPVRLHHAAAAAVARVVLLGDE